MPMLEIGATLTRHLSERLHKIQTRQEYALLDVQAAAMAAKRSSSVEKFDIVQDYLRM